MMDKLSNLDNIPEEYLERIKELYLDNTKEYRISDERKEICAFKKKPRKYFLFSNCGPNISFFNNNANIQFTFIWIENNLWQFSYVNPNTSQSNWENPLDLLNKLLKL